MKIPIYTDRVATGAVGPSPTTSPEVAAAPWVALEQVGRETTKVAQVIQEKRDDILRVNEVAERSLYAEKRISDLMRQLQTERDPSTVSEKFSDEMVNIRNESLFNVEDDKVMRSMAAFLSNREIEGTVKARHLSWQWTVENDQTSVLKTNEELLKMSTLPGTSEEDWDRYRKMAVDRISASETSGTFNPIVAEELRQKTKRRFISEYYSSLIVADPQSAIEKRYLLAELDPTQQEALYHRAIVERDQRETRMEKADKKIWDVNAANAATTIRRGKLGQDGIDKMFEEGTIGPAQKHFLESVLDASRTRIDTENTKASQTAMHGILNQVYMGFLKPEEASKKVYGMSSILPAEKDQALTAIITFSKAQDRVPSQMATAIRIYQTTIYPSSFSMNPRADQEMAFGEVMREVWTDYFANEKEYTKNPDLLIKRAIERTKSSAQVANPVPYKDLETLLKAYQREVVQAKARGEIISGREKWEDWFRQLGGAMPKWPE